MRYRQLGAALLIAAMFTPVGTGGADAASAVRINYVQYNSPGPDTGSNASLNAEWVRIKNYSSTARNLSGWTLRDTSRHVYRFGSYRLGAGRAVRIHTGRGRNTSADRYWGRSWYVWNNTGDEAILKNSSGITVDTCRWGAGGTAIAC